VYHYIEQMEGKDVSLSRYPAERVREFEKGPDAVKKIRQPGAERMDRIILDNSCVIVELKGAVERIKISEGSCRDNNQGMVATPGAEATKGRHAASAPGI